MGHGNLNLAGKFDLAVAGAVIAEDFEEIIVVESDLAKVAD